MSDKVSRNNWDKIDPFIRKDCLDHLEDWFDPKTKLQDIERLKSAYEGDGWFHFGLGMQIRNRLRDRLTDMELPVIQTDWDGDPYGPSQNWDDYYTGAVEEFLERYKNE